MPALRPMFSAVTTRLRPGARSALIVVLVSAAAALGASPEDGPGPLPWRVGGGLGFTVDAASFPDSADQMLEVYVRIPPATLRGLARSEKGEASARLGIRLRNRFGAKQQERSQDFPVAVGDTGGFFGKVAVMRFPVRAGTWQLEARLEDPNAQKRGLVFVGRVVHPSAEVKGELVVPAQQAGRAMSDIEFAWPGPPPWQGGGFRRTRRTGAGVELPNPERLYGVYANELRAAFVVRAPGADPRAWRWHARVLDRDAKVMVEAESTMTADGEWLDATARLDVSTVPSGGYDLEMKAWQSGDSGAVVRRAHFSVAWQAASWSRNPSDLEDDVHFLLEPDDEESFRRMHPGEQERYLDEFWRKRDPTPETAENEARQVYYRRMEEANRQWTQGLVKGMFSDMGRVYIRYGEPDEIHRQVIPAGDQTLNQVLVALELTEDRPTGDVHMKGLGGDTRPFEVWSYEGDWVTPLTIGENRPRSRRRLLFLFVDEQGHGEYRLRYSTE